MPDRGSPQPSNELEAGPPSSPHEVSWDGPNDPQNPLNWPSFLRWGNIIVITLINVVTPLASSMFAPAVPQVMSDLGSANKELASMVVSIYVIGYALGPLVVAPLSEMYGRLVVYHVSNGLFLVFNIGCALSTNVGMLIAFRFLAGCVGVTPIVLGGASIADVMPPDSRGAATSVWASGSLVGPIIGPVAGGYLNEKAGWRWVFWVIVIVSGALNLLGLLLLRETYGPIVLERKAKKLRDGEKDAHFISRSVPRTSRVASLRNAMLRPIKLLFTSSIVFLLSVDSAIAYGYMYLTFTTLTYVFEEQYHFSSGESGLTFLAIGIGMILSLVIVGYTSDKYAQHVSKKRDLTPEDRLPPLIPAALFIPAGLFWYGWSLESNDSWIVPLLGQALFGVGIIATIMPVQMYLMDAFGLHAASALAACMLFRSTVAATIPLAGQSLYDSLGNGWGNSLLAFIALGLSPIPFLFIKYGKQLRERSSYKSK